MIAAMADTPELVDALNLAERLGNLRTAATTLLLALKGADLETETGDALRELALEMREAISDLAADIEEQRAKRPFFEDPRK